MINDASHCDCTDCDEQQALMRAVCDALALVNVPAPITQVATPLIGGPLVPPVVTPLPPRVKFGGYYICQGCQLEASFCKCGGKPPPPPTQGDGVESSLERRARECMGGK